jgi:hypothetical protein
MGASNIEYKLSKSKYPTSTELKQWYQAAVEDARREYGSDAYNGTISTTRGIRVLSNVFTDEGEAAEFVMDTTEKWGPVVAVTLTLNDKSFWLVGGWAAE